MTGTTEGFTVPAMDTLKAARFLRDAGFDTENAEAISQVIYDLGRENLVSKEYLDMRLWQHTAAIAALFIGVASLFKLIS